MAEFPVDHKMKFKIKKYIPDESVFRTIKFLIIQGYMAISCEAETEEELENVDFSIKLYKEKNEWVIRCCPVINSFDKHGILIPEPNDMYIHPNGKKNNYGIEQIVPTP